MNAAGTKKTLLQLISLSCVIQHCSYTMGKTESKLQAANVRVTQSCIFARAQIPSRRNLT